MHTQVNFVTWAHTFISSWVRHCKCDPAAGQWVISTWHFIWAIRLCHTSSCFSHQIPQQRHGFHSSPIHVWFVEHNVALIQAFLYYVLPIKYNSTNTLILSTNHLKLTQLAQHRQGPTHPTPRVTKVIRLACEFGLHVWLNRWSDYLVFIVNKFWTKDSQCSRWFILSPHSIKESWATYSKELRFSQHFCRRLKPSEM